MLDIRQTQAPTTVLDVAFINSLEGDPAFGCPQTSNYHPQEDFSCQEKIFESLLAQSLAYPTGTKYVYSKSH